MECHHPPTRAQRQALEVHAPRTPACPAPSPPKPAQARRIGSALPLRPKASFATHVDMKRLFSKGKSSSGSATAGGGGGDAVKNLPKLHKYAYTGDLAKLSAALKKTSNVNETEPVGGRTALHLAAEQGHEKIVLRLLEVNAASRGDDTGKTPLILAVQQQHEPCVLALLHAGADPNAAATAERNTVSSMRTGALSTCHGRIPPHTISLDDIPWHSRAGIALCIAKGQPSNREGSS